MARLELQKRHAAKDPLRLPKEGSKPRVLLDALMSGKTVIARDVVGVSGSSYAVEQLRVTYGCEIDPSYPGIVLRGRWANSELIPLKELQDGYNPQTV